MSSHFLRKPRDILDTSASKLAQDLDASAEDIRQGRIEDTNTFLAEVDMEIEAYFARKNVPEFS